MRFLFLLVTIAIYWGSCKLYVRLPYPFMLPVLISSVVLVGFLLLFQIPYEDYMDGAKLIDELLGPAIVALGYPFYKQWHRIKRRFLPIIASVLVGTLIGIMSGLLLSVALRVDDLLTYSLLPKSVTTPVAMEIASEIGGEPSLAVVFVMVAGFTGVVFGPLLLKWFHIDDPLSVGMGFGCASHAIGTSKALEFGEQAAAFSSAAMTLSALLASFLAPLIVSWFA